MRRGAGVGEVEQVAATTATRTAGGGRVGVVRVSYKQLGYTHRHTHTHRFTDGSEAEGSGALRHDQTQRRASEVALHGAETRAGFDKRGRRMGACAVVVVVRKHNTSTLGKGGAWRERCLATPANARASERRRGVFTCVCARVCAYIISCSVSGAS